MDREPVKQKLIEVLMSIQAMSGLECPPITGATRPAVELRKFDSKMWPVATGMLATSLGVPIPNDVNIFSVKGTKTPLSIDETVGLVCRIISAQTSPAAAVAAH